MTLSNIQNHSPITNLFKVGFFYSYAAVNKISTDIACRAVPLRGRGKSSIECRLIIFCNKLRSKFAHCYIYSKNVLSLYLIFLGIFWTTVQQISCIWH